MIKVIYQKNAGPGIARNTGLDAMTGRYVTYVDADDYVSEKYVEIMVELLKEYKADIAEVGLLYLFGTRNYFEPSDESVMCFEGSETLIKDYFSAQQKLRNCVGGRMYDMQKFSDIRFSEKSIGEDSEYSLKMLASCERLVKYNKCLYVYRSYQESLTRQALNHKRFDIIDIALRDVEFVEALGVQLDNWDYVFQRVINTCYELMRIMAEKKKEYDFNQELNHMMSVYEKINELASKHDVELSLDLVKDIQNIDAWAREYRRNNRIQLLIKRMRNFVSGTMGAFKVKILYEYKI
jgi:glycosyltransferase involved in cell wall biosynthesis